VRLDREPASGFEQLVGQVPRGDETGCSRGVTGFVVVDVRRGPDLDGRQRTRPRLVVDDGDGHAPPP